MTLTTRRPLKSIKQAVVEHSQPNPAPQWSRADREAERPASLGDGLSSAERNVARGCAKPKDDQA